MSTKKSRPKRRLDRIDRQILCILQKDNHTPQRTIAATVNLSLASVQRRIAAMEMEGVIVGNVALVAPEVSQSLITIIVEVHLRHHRSSIVEPVKQLFRNTPEIQQCYYVTGNGGFIVIMLVPDMAMYENVSRRLFADNEVVETYRTLVVLDRVKHSTAIPILED